MHLRFKKLFLAALLFSSCFVFSQTVNDKVKLIIKQKEHTRQFFNGSTSRSTHVVIYFTVGNSPERKIGWRGRRLAAVLKSDAAAYNQFHVYKKTMNRRLGFKTTKVISELAAVVGSIVLFGSLVSDNKNGAGIMLGSVAAVGGVAGAILSSIMEYRLFNRAIGSLEKSVAIYNEDLEKKAGLKVAD
jgi:hypothetical protein